MTNFSLKLNNVALLLDKPNTEIQANQRLDTGNESSNHSLTLPINSIKIKHSQPRRYFSPQAQQELVSSIRHYGILQPILVRPLDTVFYELVAGERRYRAACEAGLTSIPVVIKNLTDEQALQLALIENLQREDLNVLEETEGILQLLSITLVKPVPDVIKILYRMQNEATGKVTENVLSSQQAQIICDIFQRLGTITWESFIPTRLHLLSLPDEILEALRQGEIEYTKACAIAKIKDSTLRLELLQSAIAQQWTLTQIKEKIQSHLSIDQKSSSNNPQQRIKDFTIRLKKTKVYQDPQKWKKIEGYLAKIETLMEKEEN